LNTNVYIIFLLIGLIDDSIKKRTTHKSALSQNLTSDVTIVTLTVKVGPKQFKNYGFKHDVDIKFSTLWIHLCTWKALKIPS